jgi:hypothetical protein
VLDATPRLQKSHSLLFGIITQVRTLYSAWIECLILYADHYKYIFITNFSKTSPYFKLPYKAQYMVFTRNNSVLQSCSSGSRSKTATKEGHTSAEVPVYHSISRHFYPAYILSYAPGSVYSLPISQQGCWQSSVVFFFHVYLLFSEVSSAYVRGKPCFASTTAAHPRKRLPPQVVSTVFPLLEIRNRHRSNFFSCSFKNKHYHTTT